MSTQGMRTFRIVWSGQLVSVLGSGLTSFALGIWVFLETGSVTAFAMISLATTVPGMLLAPISGTYIDRWDRRIIMLVADLVAGLTTLSIAIVFLTSDLQLWHIYLNAVIVSISGSFQEPAYMAALPTLVDKDRLSQANGQVQLGQAIGTLISPALAGVLIVSIGLGGIMLIDFVTFLFALGTLLKVRFPALARDESRDESASFWSEAMEGWRYLRSRSGLVALLLIFAGVNFLLSIVMVLFTPMMLSFTTEQVMGFTVSAAGLGDDRRLGADELVEGCLVEDCRSPVADRSWWGRRCYRRQSARGLCDRHRCFCADVLCPDCQRFESGLVADQGAAEHPGKDVFDQKDLRAGSHPLVFHPRGTAG